MSDSITEYKKWLANQDLDEELRAELTAIENDPKEIEERFAFPLAFGTGGLRGIIRAGTNGMNIYTVAQATQGLAELVKKDGGAEMGVVIASDTRIKSDVFSEISARVLAANGIPRLSFRCAASHAGAFVCSAAFARQGRYQCDRIAQSEHLQRLQGLLGGRRTDFTRTGRRGFGCYRKGRYLHRRQACKL